MPSDWELLFAAVSARLRVIAGDARAVPAATLVPNAAADLRASVLECADALDQVHVLINAQLAELARQSVRRGEAV